VLKKQWTLTQESFDRLLAWLHSDCEQAGKKYEEVRSKLVRGFMSHGCPVSEELADETINRVARRLPEIEKTYVGEPMRYFYRVAHYIHLEYLRKESEVAPLPPGELSLRENSDNIEPEYECLERCLQQLTPRNRELVLQYYQGEKGVKIEARKVLAQSLNIKLPALRLQAHRIRTNMKKCIQECLAQMAA
jgi:DNA-directed RNA polymerase specialized sigma24 family protein